MPIIFETENMTVKAHDKPHHSRENGGHIVVAPKLKYEQRYDIPLDIATEMMHVTMVTGEAATNVLRQVGIDVVRINYQDNGNWAYKEPQYPPSIHQHLYIRTNGEKHPMNDPRFAAFPDALCFPDPGTGYYDSFQPLTIEDCAAIKQEVERLLTSNKYAEVTFLIQS